MSKSPHPVSVRFSRAELTHIAEEAAKRSLSRSEYIRTRTLDAGEISDRGGEPSRNKLLAQILGRLGHSSLPQSISEMATAAKHGHLAVDDETAAKLDRACSEIFEIRLLLMKALGLCPGGDR